MKKIFTLKLLEIVSAIIIFGSKFFLFFENPWGWAIATIGYILIAMYNYLRDIKILAVVVAGLAFLTLYGLMKWLQEQKGLFLLDYLVMASMMVGAVWLSYHEWKKKKPFWKLQLIVTILFVIAYMCLGYYFLLAGWATLMLSHVVIGYIYFHKKAYWYFGIQVLSIIVAGVKIITLIF